MKKLTKRQKLILLSGVGILFLTILISALLIANQTKKSKEVVPTQEGLSAPPEDKENTQNLVRKRKETITTLEKKINTDNIKTDDLLSELKNKPSFPTTETDWKKSLEKYLEGATTTTELEARKQNVLTVISKLTGGPSGPSGPSGPTPQPQPENQ